MRRPVQFGEILKDYFSLQNSSIRLFRIAFALTAVWYLIDFFPVVWQLSKADGLFNISHSIQHYTGVIPKLTLVLPPDLYLGVSAILLLVGITLITFNRYPRVGFGLAAIAIYLTSFRIRPLIYGGNNTLFWAAVLGSTLPRLDTSSEPSKRIFSLTTFLIHLQIFSIYFQSGIYKSGPGWQSTFTATEAALRNPHYANSWGTWLAGLPYVSDMLTLSVLFLEIPMALLFILGFIFTSPKIKIVFAILAIGFHLGTAAFLNLRFFPFASITLLLLLIPGESFSRISRFGALSVRHEPRLWPAQLTVIGLVLCGLVGVGLPKWLPSQKFRYFSPSPDTKFVDLHVKFDNAGVFTEFEPLKSQDLEIPDFYKKRIQWAISRFMIRSESWVEFYCRKSGLSLESGAVTLDYVWSYYDERNTHILRTQTYSRKYPCGLGLNDMSAEKTSE